MIGFSGIASIDETRRETERKRDAWCKTMDFVRGNNLVAN